MAITDIRAVQYFKEEWVDTENGAFLMKVPTRYDLEMKLDSGEWKKVPVVHVEENE